MSESILRVKLFEDVANRIVEHIRSREWTAGQRIPAEPELAKYFDVSRSTVRNAIKILQSESILYSRPGSGTYVADTAPLLLETRELMAIMADSENIFDLIGARYILEPQLAALAAENATPTEIERLYAILEKMGQEQDRYNLMTSGYAFHQAVAELSHNKVLYGFYLSAASQLRSMRVLDTLTLETFVQGIDDHRHIARAIAEKDAALAKALMRTHLRKDYAHYLDNTEIME